MKILDIGHIYELSSYDGEIYQTLQFMKREGSNYPYNTSSYPGTNCQEVIKVLIDRTKYLDLQKPAPENQIILNGLRNALLGFELRAARRHERAPLIVFPIEAMQSCIICGHINCGGH